MDKAVIKSCDYCKDPVSGLMSIMNEEYEELYVNANMTTPATLTIEVQTDKRFHKFKQEVNFCNMCGRQLRSNLLGTTFEDYFGDEDEDVDYV